MPQTSNNSTVQIVGIAVGAVAGVIVLAAIVAGIGIVFWRRRKQRQPRGTFSFISRYDYDFLSPFYIIIKPSISKGIMMIVISSMAYRMITA